MEEDVWRELTLSSLHHHHPHHPSAAATSTAVPIAPGLTLQGFLSCPFTKTVESESENGHEADFPSPPPNLLSNFCGGSKRKGGGPSHDVNPSEWKKMRLMKNRESAARSRARKQAYTYELELEIAHLEKENAKLRKELEELCAAALSDANQKKPELWRTLTAPF